MLSLSRGPYRWRMGVPRDGRLPGGGSLPTLIQWEGGEHPCNELPATAISLLEFHAHGGRLSATFDTPAGRRTLQSAE